MSVVWGRQLTAGAGRINASVAVRDMVWLALFALALRLGSYNGVFGSDDLTYLGSAIDVATGAWAPSSYNGALRYGFNLPAGLFIWLFGTSPVVANLWPLLCSLIEIGCIYAVASSVLNRRAGLIAAILLSAAPLHMAVATRIHADAVVSMFLTLSFTLLWFGWLHRHRAVLFACGLAMGGVFWSKELVAVTWLAFLPMLWLFRRRWWDVLPVIAGLLIMLVLHGALMMALNGHPLHLILTVLGAVKRNFIEGMAGEDSAAYYLGYLFLNIRHSGLLGFLALLALCFVPRALAGGKPGRAGILFVAGWAVGLLVVLSVFPVSLSPLRFVLKQSNYITLLLGPLALLSGLALAGLPQRVARLLLIVSVLVGVLLGFLQQADYRVFTSNSKAVSSWLVDKPGAVFVGSTHNARLSASWGDMTWPGQAQSVLLSFDEVDRDHEKYQAARRQAADLYVVLDRQTMNWLPGRTPVLSPQACWGAAIQRLPPADLGAGNALAGWIADAAGLLSRQGISAAHAVELAFRNLARPQPADLYKVEQGGPFCRDR